MANGRQAHIDAIKGFAILLVVMGHVNNLNLHSSGLNFAQYYDTVHMPLFAICSGLFATKPLDLRFKGVLTYWKSKVLRLLLPLLFLPPIYYVFSGLNSVGEYWFTLALFLIGVIFYLHRFLSMQIERVLPEKKQWIGEILIFIAMVALVKVSRGVMSSMDNGSMLWHLTDKVFWLYRYFAFGYLVRRLNIESYLKRDWVGATSLVALLTGLAYLILSKSPFRFGEDGLFHVSNLIVIANFCFIYYVADRSVPTASKWLKLLVKMGEWSLAIYFVHFFFIFKVGSIYDFLRGNLTASLLGIEVGTALIGTVLTLIPTLFVIRCIKSNKYLDFLLFGEKLPKNNNQ